MKSPVPPAPQVRKTKVTTSAFPGLDRRWSADLILTWIDDRLAGWETVEYVYSLPDGWDAFRFSSGELEEQLQDLACRLHSHAGAWIKANHGEVAKKRG